MVQEINREKNTNWLGEKKPYYFFGPCSAESREQVLETAKGISANFEDVIFRAGIWKPRTRPGTFEGIGSVGLDWLKEVKETFGFKTTTEVATAKHVEECLKSGVDYIWIGARTTVNPFSVQEIANALEGVDIPVFVKNPIYPDLSLWLGAIERIQKAGIEKFGAIHRGFQLQDNGPYRNNPYWDLAIRLRSKYPNIPLICDASHISGTPDLIEHVAQKAIDLDMDGLMVETHVSPEIALSDSQQQVTPLYLNALINNLTPKSKDSINADFKSNIERLREQIDKVDDELLEKLAVRMELAKQIGEDKRQNNVTILQIERWKKTLDRSIENGSSLGLSNRFIEGMLHLIHDESIRKQTDSLE
jgi:chorismate mutase